MRIEFRSLLAENEGPFILHVNSDIADDRRHQASAHHQSGYSLNIPWGIPGGGGGVVVGSGVS